MCDVHNIVYRVSHHGFPMKTVIKIEKSRWDIMYIGNDTFSIYYFVRQAILTTQKVVLAFM